MSEPSQDMMIEAEGVDPLQLAYCDMSDLGNSQRLVARGQGRLMFSPSIGWLAFNGHCWSAEEGEMLAHRLAHETAQGIRIEAQALVEHAKRLASDGKAEASAMARERADDLFGWAVQAGNAGRTVAMLAQGKHYMRVAPDQLDRDRMAITLSNGTLKIRDCASRGVDFHLKNHDPADAITREAAVAYDPSAQCPGWRAHIARCLPNLEMSDFFQKMIGYAFSGHVSEQCFFMLQGPGQDGKSTTMNIIRRVMGGYAAVADVKTFLDLGQRSGADASPDLARLSGDVRLVSCSEPPRGAKLNEALLKGITGGAPITARHLNRDPFEYSPRFKIVMEVNDRPRVMGGDDGVWRRIVPIPFTRKIPDNEIDRTLEDRLVETEGPGILNWALEGLAMWMAEGLVRPEPVREAVADYRAASNPFSEWFYDRCERDERAEESAADLYRDYQTWCEAGNYEPISNTAFGRALGDRQVIRRKGAGGRIFRRGVRLKSHDYDPTAGSSAPSPDKPPMQGSMLGDDYDPYAM